MTAPRDTAIRRTIAPGRVKFAGLAAGQFRGVISDSSVDRYGDVVEPAGIKYAAFVRSGTILAQHDAGRPIARPIKIDVFPDRVEMVGEFPALGVSATADEYRRLMQARVLNNFSIGFIPLEMEPIKGGGWHYISWEIVECSVVSVPANSNAIVTERSARGLDGMRHLLRAEIERERRKAQIAGTLMRRPVEPATCAEISGQIRELRRRYGIAPQTDPRAIAAESAFRLRNW